MYAVIFAIGFAFFTFGALSERAGNRDLRIEAAVVLLLAIGFILGSAPRAWSIVPRAILPLPTFLIFLVTLSDRKPEMPFFAAFVGAGFYALFITAFADFISHRHRPNGAPPDRRG